MAKKRGQNEGSIRKRKDGKWEARVTVGINPNGSNRRKSLYGKTRQEVSIKMAEFLNDLHKGTLIDPTNKTVAEWLDEWMHDYKKLVLKPTSYINYMGYIDRQIVPMLGKYKLKDLRTDTVQKFIQDLVRLDLATGTIYGIVKVLKSAIKQAYINGMISKNVTFGVTMPKNEKISRKAFTPEQQNILQSLFFSRGKVGVFGIIRGCGKASQPHCFQGKTGAREIYTYYLDKMGLCFPLADSPSCICNRHLSRHTEI